MQNKVQICFYKPSLKIIFGDYITNHSNEILIIMGIEFKKEGNACERCHKSDTDVGMMAHYKNHGLDELLCQDCIKEIEDYYSLKCSKCGKPAHMRGNLIEFENKKICTICMDEIKMKEITKQDSV